MNNIGTVTNHWATTNLAVIRRRIIFLRTMETEAEDSRAMDKGGYHILTPSVCNSGSSG